MIHEHPCTRRRERLEAFTTATGRRRTALLSKTISVSGGRALPPRSWVTLVASLASWPANRRPATSDEPLRISARVLERLRVDEQFSMLHRSSPCSRICTWCGGLGATVATMICVIGSASAAPPPTSNSPVRSQT